jgi:hypothetical protein
LDDPYAADGNGRDDGSLATADRTVAATWINDSVGEIELKDHGSAMAGEAMLREDGDATDRLDHNNLLGFAMRPDVSGIEASEFM